MLIIVSKFRIIDHVDGEKDHEEEPCGGSQEGSETGNAFAMNWLVSSKGKEKRFYPCLLESLLEDWKDTEQARAEALSLVP